MLSRRRFICNTLQAGVAIAVPHHALHALNQLRRLIKIGLITDLHQDIMHDGLQRMQAFAAHVKKVKPDAIVQMGDFAYPGEKNKEVIGLFNQTHSTRMHVIGNHDTDAGYTKDQCIQYWGMPSRYYTQVVEGICFIVLDANDKGSPTYKSGYHSYINQEQSEWLEDQLSKSRLPVVVVSHQPLAGVSAVDNATAIQAILSKHKHKVLLAINGHTHVDAAFETGGITYVHINSASYFWVGGKYKHDSYPKEVIKDHEWIASTCPYRDPLFSTLTIDPQKQVITLEGSTSEWVGPSPQELQVDALKQSIPGLQVAPHISNRTITQKNVV